MIAPPLKDTPVAIRDWHLIISKTLLVSHPYEAAERIFR